MNYRNIHDFIKVLESSQELIRIKAPVSPYLEISEITDRVSKSKDGGKALLFENVVGSLFPVLINAFGSKKRLTLALGGESPDQIGERLRKLLDNALPKTLGDKLRLLKRAFDVSRYLPRAVKTNRPPSQEVILKNEEVDLAILPIIHCWPHDSAPFITFP
ncbi:MAG TPA: UbiD family decarboxylase domain-containing protein, partial [Syntrophales bacterium]|nr:UbiD family decarboxylase domain-containing protein [Syntrophales bacterium]